MGKKSKKVVLEEKIEKEKKYNIFQRLYVYQKERFPVVTFALYIACIVIGVFFITDAYAAKESGKFLKNSVETIFYNRDYFKMIPMFIAGFLQFFMVRVIDEHKDFEEDSKFRNYRPVPRGLISLKVLKVLFVISFIAQFLITTLWGGSLLLLVILWCAVLLLANDFFIKDFIDRHILVGVILDEAIMPVLALLMASFCVEEHLLFYLLGNTGFIYLVYLTYVISWIVELARKIRCKKDEEKGVKTYTQVFGIPKAVLLLGLFEMFAYMLQTTLLNRNYDTDCLFIFLTVMVINVLFVLTENRFFSKLVELVANVYIIVVYLSFIVLAFPI